MTQVRAQGIYQKSIQIERERELTKFALETYGLTLPQFRAMCEGASKQYEGQGLASVDAALAKEAYFAGFIDGVREAAVHIDSASSRD